MLPYITMGKFLTFLYFYSVLVIFPLNNLFEKLAFDLYILRHDRFLLFMDGFKAALNFHL